jgi:aspartate carbamoyltransferase catalytic subunit
VQKERFTDPVEYDKVKDCYVITPEVMRPARSRMIVIHPLPRGSEIDQSVDSNSRAAYSPQMENGMYVRMAFLAAVPGKG